MSSYQKAEEQRQYSTALLLPPKETILNPVNYMNPSQCLTASTCALLIIEKSEDRKCQYCFQSSLSSKFYTSDEVINTFKRLSCETCSIFYLYQQSAKILWSIHSTSRFSKETLCLDDQMLMLHHNMASSFFKLCRFSFIIKIKQSTY